LLNLGGMANVTWVPRRGVTAGAVAFDTGPGVAVIDAVTRRVDPDAPYDQDGERARRGHPDLKALHQLLTDPFFDQPPPKSTGRAGSWSRAGGPATRPWSSGSRDGCGRGPLSRSPSSSSTARPRRRSPSRSWAS